MFNRTAAVAALLVLCQGALPAFAADDAMGGMQMNGMKSNAMHPMGARFGGSVYSGRPKLQNTLALVEAGGGPGDFKTTTLVGVLAGPDAHAEVVKLTKQFGATNVKSFITTFDFVIADALRLVKKNDVTLPATPAPSSSDGKALSAALYKDGVDSSSGSFNVEYMLDHLVSHPLHVQIMHDIDAKYGRSADATYHVALLQVMKDLKAAYTL